MVKKRVSLEGGPSGLVGAPDIMKPEIIVFCVTGISPLLQNNPINFIGKDEASGLSVGKKVYVDEDEARLRLYPGRKGTFCHPCEAFTKSMVKAASGKKFGKMFATSLLKGAVFVVEDLAVIEDEDGEPLTQYRIDKRSVVIGKSRVARCRPIWDKWVCRVPLEVDVAILRPEDVLDCLRLAGRIVGVGDYRPACGGGFGRFTAEIA